MKTAALFLVAVLLGTVPAHAASPCSTTTYRHHVVAVLGTSEDLVGTSVAAWGQLKQGHRARGMELLRSVVDYSPTYYDRERHLIDVTVGCDA